MQDANPHGQGDDRLRFDWGPAGADALGGDVVVVVDVLSFTTTLGLAVARGTEVLPFAWDEAGARALAAATDAVAAGRRSAGRRGDVSLSPLSVVAAPPPPRIVLPSPNGSALAHAVAGSGRVLLGASLRNADAVAAWIADHVDHGTDPPVVAVIAAGERWPDGSLRPAVEDLWGAGAVLAGLLHRRRGSPSPEAEVAVAAFRAVAADLPARLRACASGRELVAAGYPDDVRLASALDVDRSVPLLRADRFVDAAR